MKKFFIVALAIVISLSLIGCTPASTVGDTAVDENKTVSRQDALYAKTQPVPFFNYSLPRDLWIQFYKASTSNVVRTWSYPVDINGEPMVELESVGYPIPMDTQLTNPDKLIDMYAHSSYTAVGTVAQSEPNGLYTSQNTNATIIMTVDGDGKVAPVYSEPTVLCFPYPVRYDKEKGMFARVEGSKSSISLDIKK